LRKVEGRGQRAEGRGRKPESGKRKAESGEQITENGNRGADAGFFGRQGCHPYRGAEIRERKPGGGEQRRGTGRFFMEVPKPILISGIHFSG